MSQQIKSHNKTKQDLKSFKAKKARFVRQTEPENGLIEKAFMAVINQLQPEGNKTTTRRLLDTKKTLQNKIKESLVKYKTKNAETKKTVYILNSSDEEVVTCTERSTITTPRDMKLFHQTAQLNNNQANDTVESDVDCSVILFERPLSIITISDDDDTDILENMATQTLTATQPNYQIPKLVENTCCFEYSLPSSLTVKTSGNKSNVTNEKEPKPIIDFTDKATRKLCHQTNAAKQLPVSRPPHIEPQPQQQQQNIVPQLGNVTLPGSSNHNQPVYPVQINPHSVLSFDIVNLGHVQGRMDHKSQQALLNFLVGWHTYKLHCENIRNIDMSTTWKNGYLRVVCADENSRNYLFSMIGASCNDICGDQNSLRHLFSMYGSSVIDTKTNTPRSYHYSMADLMPISLWPGCALHAVPAGTVHDDVFNGQKCIALYTNRQMPNTTVEFLDIVQAHNPHLDVQKWTFCRWSYTTKPIGPMYYFLVDCKSYQQLEQTNGGIRLDNGLTLYFHLLPHQKLSDN